MVCFVHFDLQMCFAAQRRAIFSSSSGQMAQHPPLQRAYFSPSRPTNHWKNIVFRGFATFLTFRAPVSPVSSFFQRFLSSTLLFYSSCLLFFSTLLCFSSLHIVGSLTSKLPLINLCWICSCILYRSAFILCYLPPMVIPFTPLWGWGGWYCMTVVEIESRYM